MSDLSASTLRHRALERDDVEEVERVEDDEHRDDAEVAEAEAVGDEDRRLVARETRKPQAESTAPWIFEMFVIP